MHPGVQLSGVYYVDDGGYRNGGVRFVDPRPQASMVPTPSRWTFGMGEHVRVQALPGLFVLFPAWLQHYVVAHEGSRSRVSVSFNVRLTFPTDEGQSGGFVGGGATSSTVAPSKLSFTVPSQHQQDFLNAAAAKDMLVS